MEQRIIKSIIAHLRNQKVFVKADNDGILDAENIICLFNKNWSIVIEVMPLNTAIRVVNNYSLKTSDSELPVEFRTTKNVAEQIINLIQQHKSYTNIMGAVR